MSNYILGYGAQAPAETMFGDAAIGGRFFYNDELTGLNFQRRSQPLAQSLELLPTMSETGDPAALYVGALPLPTGLPGFADDNRFTLFPPEQLSNLYVGPLDFTLAGQPVSMVRIEEPDHDRFPRFREAWRHAQGAELGRSLPARRGIRAFDPPAVLRY